LQALSACSTLPKIIDPLPEQFALPPATVGPLAELDASIANSHEADQSGFWLLDKNADALNWRLALIDEAVSSLDLMYYLWYGDDSGSLLLRRVIQAADRGVKVRFIVDDLLLMGKDKTLVALNDHPNIKFRIANPWQNRKAGRGMEFVGRFSQLNSRMHNKLLIADNHATILGGRNIGDSYFGLNQSYNFHDLDVLGIGPVARQASAMFDDFWNSSWVISASVLPAKIDDKYVANKTQQSFNLLQAAESLQGFTREPRDWAEELKLLSQQLHFGSSEFVYDKIENGNLIEGVKDPLAVTLNSADHSIILVNAYIIPNQDFVDAMRKLTGKGVRVLILTNSLASHDVPAVNSHYQKWRKPIIETGAELYELRFDPAIKSRVDTQPVNSNFTGLHTKAFVVDSHKVFIGSMNFDPRSANINAEMGVTIESTTLGEEMVRLAQRDMSSENAWQVKLNEQGKLMWLNSEETVTRQPARSLWQRFMDGFFKIFPESQF
jgi:putative cardiolipin synthase